MIISVTTVRRPRAAAPADNTKRTSLLEAKGVNTADGVAWNWDLEGSGAELSQQEMRALHAKHGARSPNWVRASEVKALMVAGQTLDSIAASLANRYGRRMIADDHAALLDGGVRKPRRRRTLHKSATK